MMYSACKFNKQGDNIQPWHTPFPIWNQSVIPCPVLTVASWPAYRFVKGQVQVVWYCHLFQNFPQLIVNPTVKGFGIVNKAEIDVFFLELSCCFHDPADVGNLISGSSAFSKTSLNIWKFTVHLFSSLPLDFLSRWFFIWWWWWLLQFYTHVLILHHPKQQFTLLAVYLNYQQFFLNKMKSSEVRRHMCILNSHT